MFIASTYWNGAMNVNNMRLCDTEEEAWKWIETVAVPIQYELGFVRVYEVFKDKPPRLCKQS